MACGWQSDLGNLVVTWVTQDKTGMERTDLGNVNSDDQSLVTCEQNLTQGTHYGDEDDLYLHSLKVLCKERLHNSDVTVSKTEDRSEGIRNAV